MEASGELVRYLEVRADIVTEVTASVVQAVRAESTTEFFFMDQAAAEPPLLGPTVVDAALASGVSPSSLTEFIDGYEVLGYRSTPDEIAGDLEAYALDLGPGTAIRMGLRPVAPDSTTVDDLEGKLRAGLELGVSGFDFYHLGLIGEDAVERVSEALRRVGLARSTAAR